MSWETRRGTQARYYYRARRADGRIVKTCYGSGDRATVAARQDAAARAARRADADAAKALRSAMDPLDRLSAEADGRVDELVEALLFATGHHCHRGQWRKRGHGRHDDDHDDDRHPGGGGATAAGQARPPADPLPAPTPDPDADPAPAGAGPGA